MKTPRWTLRGAAAASALLLAATAGTACIRQAAPVAARASAGAVIIGRLDVQATVRPGDSDKKLPILRQRIVARNGAGSWQIEPADQGLSSDFYLVLPPGTYRLEAGYAHSGATDGAAYREARWEDTEIEFTARAGEAVCIGEVVGARSGGAAQMLLSVITKDRAMYEFTVQDRCAEIGERFAQRHPGREDAVAVQLATAR